MRNFVKLFAALAFVLLALCAGPVQAAVTATFAATGNTTSTSNPLTFTAFGIGTASAGRYVAVVYVNRGTLGEPTAITVGGVSCVHLYGFTPANAAISFWMTSTPITSGTTADVVITQSGTNDTTRIVTYAVTGVYGFVTGGSVDGAGGKVISNVTVPANGALIVAAGRNSGTETPNISASGATLTSDSSGNANTLGWRVSHATSTSTLTGVTLTETTSASIPSMAYITLAPYGGSFFQMF